MTFLLLLSDAKVLECGGGGANIRKLQIHENKMGWLCVTGQKGRNKE